jgi:hypothetical protein
MSMAAEPMNGYGLIAVLVQSVASLAWPVAFVFAVWLFRKKLEELLPLFRVKHKDWEILFDRAEKEAAELPQPAIEVEVPVPTPEEQKRFVQLAENSPQAVILELRRELEIALRQAVERTGEFHSEGNSMLMLTRMLRNIGAIDQHTSALLEELRNLGNAAAVYSEKTFSPSDAFRYRDLADKAIKQLNAIPAKK